MNCLLLGIFFRMSTKIVFTELFIAEQARKLNLNMVYEPTLQVEHNEHATTGVFKSRRMVTYLHQSYTYILKTYFN